MLGSLSLQNKIVAICLVLAGIAGITGGLGYFALHAITRQYSHVTQVNLPNSNTLGDMRGEYRNARIALRTLGMEGLTPELAEKARKNTVEAMDRYEAADKRYNEIPFVEGEQALYEALNKEWKEYKAEALRVVELSKAHNAESRAQMQEFFFKTAVANTERFNSAMRNLIAFQLEQSEKAVQRASSAESWGTTLILIATLVGFGLALVLGITFSRALSRTLRSIAETLSSGASEVAAAASEISSTSESLSSGATEQAAAIQETASSIEEMNAMVRKNADNSTRSSSVAQESRSTATDGQQVVQKMMSAISDISDSNNAIMRQIGDSNREISEITKVIAEIANKTKVINDIVFQTKLLSFNASVEAARAGEHGKGFAVVAEEVGNLAQMSGNAAKEIAEMLESSIQKVERIVTETQTKVESLVMTGKSKVETGTSVARECGDVFEKIVGGVSQVAQMVSEISTASTEQAQGVHEINKAMGQLDQVTQQNTAASHQAAAAAEQLAKQAETLRTSVESLLQAVNGGSQVREQDSREQAAPVAQPSLAA